MNDSMNTEKNDVFVFKNGDLQEIKNILWNRKGSGCEDCFLSFFVWKNNYQIEKKTYKDGTVFYLKKNGSYLFPDPHENGIKIIHQLLEENKSIKFERLTELQKKIIEKEFSSRAVFSEDTGSFDYIYSTEALANLAGSKLSKKRNHINRFINEYSDWSIEEINKSNILEIIDFAKDWYDKKTGGDSEIGSESLLQEKSALLLFLPMFEDFEADGIVLRVNKKIIAFTIGQRISEQYYDVVFEKADNDILGAYNMINREFVRYLAKKYPGVDFINRENDLNLPGLRKAKLSYKPAFLLKKYNCVIN